MLVAIIIVFLYEYVGGCLFFVDYPQSIVDFINFKFSTFKAQCTIIFLLTFRNFESVKIVWMSFSLDVLSCRYKIKDFKQDCSV